MLHEELVDRPTGGLGVLHLQHGADVVHHIEGEVPAHQLLYLRPHILVTGVDDGELIGDAKSRFRLCSINQLHDLDDPGCRPSVSAPGEEYHVRPQAAYPLYLLEHLASVVLGYDIHDDGARAQRCPIGALGGHRLDEAGDHHLKTSPSTARGDVEVHTDVPVIGDDYAAAVAGEYLEMDELLHLPHGVLDAHGDVLEGSLDGRRRLACHEEPPFPLYLVEESGLCSGTPDVGRQNVLHLIKRFPG